MRHTPCGYTPPQVQLTPLGETVDKVIRNIDSVYRDVTVKAYVIMPNHVHLLISLETPPDTPPNSSDASGNDGGVGHPALRRERKQAHITTRHSHGPRCIRLCGG